MKLNETCPVPPAAQDDFEQAPHSDLPPDTLDRQRFEGMEHAP